MAKLNKETFKKVLTWLGFASKAQFPAAVAEEVKVIEAPVTIVKTQSDKDRETRKRKYYSNQVKNDSRGKGKKGSLPKKNA